MRQKLYGLDIKLQDNILEIVNKDENIVIKYKLHQKIFENGVVQTTGYTGECITKKKLAFDHNEIILEGLLRLKIKYYIAI